MLVYTFCTHPPAIQQQKTTSGAKEIYSAKLKMFFFFILQKSKNSISNLCHFKKQVCGVWHVYPLKYVLGCFSIPDQKYLGMQWHAIFNAHFSVPVNFVLFVSLDIFLQLNFVSMNICHFFQLSFSFCADCFVSQLEIYQMIQAFLYVFFIHSESSIGVLEKMFHPLPFQNIVLMKILRNFPLKHPFWSPLFKDIYRPSWCAKNQSLSEVCARFRHAKESMPKKSQACAKACACDHMPHMMKFGLVIHVISFWIRNISDSQ